MYSYLKDNDKEQRTAKGIKKNVIRKDIKHANYKDTLFGKKTNDAYNEDHQEC